MLVESVRRFKGLEKPVIVLVEFEGLLDHQDLLYVAASRARSLLVIIGAAEVCRRFRP